MVPNEGLLSEARLLRFQSLLLTPMVQSAQRTPEVPLCGRLEVGLEVRCAVDGRAGQKALEHLAPARQIDVFGNHRLFVPKLRLRFQESV